MLHIVLTDDWELRGNGSGNPRALQFQTARALMDLYERFGLRCSFNVDVLQQLAFRQAAAKHPELGAIADEWDACVREMLRRGHDVELAHPSPVGRRRIRGRALPGVPGVEPPALPRRPGAPHPHERPRVPDRARATREPGLPLCRLPRGRVGARAQPGDPAHAGRARHRLRHEHRRGHGPRHGGRVLRLPHGRRRLPARTTRNWRTREGCRAGSSRSSAFRP